MFPWFVKIVHAAWADGWWGPPSGGMGELETTKWKPRLLIHLAAHFELIIATARILRALSNLTGIGVESAVLQDMTAVAAPALSTSSYMLLSLSWYWVYLEAVWQYKGDDTLGNPAGVLKRRKITGCLYGVIIPPFLVVEFWGYAVGIADPESDFGAKFRSTYSPNIIGLLILFFGLSTAGGSAKVYQLVRGLRKDDPNARDTMWTINLHIIIGTAFAVGGVITTVLAPRLAEDLESDLAFLLRHASFRILELTTGLMLIQWVRTMWNKERAPAETTVQSVMHNSTSTAALSNVPAAPIVTLVAKEPTSPAPSDTSADAIAVTTNPLDPAEIVTSPTTEANRPAGPSDPDSPREGNSGPPTPSPPTPRPPSELESSATSANGDSEDPVVNSGEGEEGEEVAGENTGDDGP